MIARAGYARPGPAISDTPVVRGVLQRCGRVPCDCDEEPGVLRCSAVGKSLASGLPQVSFGATCLNALQVFSYHKPVVSMLARIRQNQRHRLYQGGQDQKVAPDAPPQPQPDASGHVVLGSLLGGGLGLLAGGLGLLAGALLGGLL